MNARSVFDRADDCAFVQVNHLDFGAVGDIKPMRLGIHFEVIPLRRTGNWDVFDEVVGICGGGRHSCQGKGKSRRDKAEFSYHDKNAWLIPARRSWGILWRSQCFW